MEGQSFISNLQEKLKGIGGESMAMMKNTQGKFKEMRADDMLHNLQEKLKAHLLMLENFGLYLMAWVDNVFPPETRKERIQHWIHVSAPFVVPGLALLVIFWCCRRCLHSCGGIKVGKTMKAPGRNFRMSQSSFEANPKGYFRGLRDKKLIN